MNRLTITGHIGSDAVIRDAGENKVINFSVAYTEKFTNREGIKQEKTVWVNCSYFRKPDRIGLAPFLTKGAHVLVEGSVEPPRVYQNSSGEWVANIDIKVGSIELLDKKQA